MRILSIERPVPGVADEQFRPEMAVLVLECPDVAQGDAALASQPMVSAGLIEFEVLPLRA